MPIRMAPKLSRKHINLPPFKKLLVRLVTQTLSHSVAAGITTLTKWGALPAESQHTADFIESFDQIFNYLNSRTLKSPAKWRHAFSETSGQKEFLMDTKNWLDRLKSKGIIFLFLKPYKCCNGTIILNF